MKNAPGGELFDQVIKESEKDTVMNKITAELRFYQICHTISLVWLASGGVWNQRADAPDVQHHHRQDPGVVGQGDRGQIPEIISGTDTTGVLWNTEWNEMWLYMCFLTQIFSKKELWGSNRRTLEEFKNYCSEQYGFLYKNNNASLCSIDYNIDCFSDASLNRRLFFSRGSFNPSHSWNEHSWQLHTDLRYHGKLPL